MFQLCPTMAILVLVLNSCEECLEQVRYIGFLLHKKDIEDQRINTLTENFSLQILHEPLMFSVSGFFQMDFMFLRSIVAAITTYMVIFIQFMPKEPETKNMTTTSAPVTTTQITPTEVFTRV
jgi:7tm Chemosensory receptor